MALSYDFTKCIAREGQSIIDEEHWPAADRLLWDTMVLGMNLDSDSWGAPHQTDEEQAIEFATRFVMFRRLYGSTSTAIQESADLGEVLKAIWPYRGLNTNVSYEKRHVWLNRMAKQYAERVESAMRTAAEKMEVPA